jgi:hypothetical protein
MLSSDASLIVRAWSSTIILPPACVRCTLSRHALGAPRPRPGQSTVPFGCSATCNADVSLGHGRRKHFYATLSILYRENHEWDIQGRVKMTAVRGLQASRSRRTIRAACPRRLSGLSVSHSESVSYGVFVCMGAQGEFNSRKWRFPARAVNSVPVRATRLRVFDLWDELDGHITRKFRWASLGGGRAIVSPYPLSLHRGAPTPYNILPRDYGQIFFTQNK